MENAPDISYSPSRETKKSVSSEPAENISVSKEVIKPTMDQLSQKWKEFLFLMEKKNKHLLKTHLEEGSIAEVSGNTVTLEFKESSVFQLDLLNQPSNIEFIEKELSAFFRTNLNVRFRMVPDSDKKEKH